MSNYKSAIGIKSGLIQPKFSTLRLLTDINESNKDDFVFDTNVRFKNFWILDEHIHEKFNKKLINIEEIQKNAPKKQSLSFFDYIPPIKLKEKKAKKDEEYQKRYNQHELAIKEAKSINEQVNYFNEVKAWHNYTCHFCHFVDEQYIEIHHLNHDHFDNSFENLVTACTLCHRQHHLLWLSVKNQATLGELENSILDQTELNHLQRISLVLNRHPDPSIKKAFGDQSALTSLFSQYTNSFSRPLHSVMVESDQKAKQFESYINATPFVFSRTGVDMPFNELLIAIDHFENPEPPTPFKQKDLAKQKQLEGILSRFEELVGLKQQMDLDKNTPKDEHIYRSITLVRPEITLYKKVFEKKFHEEFNEKTESFSCFDMALSIKSMPYKDFDNLNLPNYYLFFNSNIFTEDQIKHYLKLDYFNPKNWNFNNENN